MNTVETVAKLAYSPNPRAESMKIVLEESDLKNADINQFNRFLRVWIGERSLYPKLHELVIVLRQGEELNNVGIQTFNRLYQPYAWLDHTKVIIE